VAGICPITVRGCRAELYLTFPSAHSRFRLRRLAYVHTVRQCRSATARDKFCHRFGFLFIAQHVAPKLGLLAVPALEDSQHTGEQRPSDTGCALHRRLGTSGTRVGVRRGCDPMGGGCYTGRSTSRSGARSTRTHGDLEVLWGFSLFFRQCLSNPNPDNDSGANHCSLVP